MLEDKLKGVKGKLLVLALSAAGAIAAQGCGATYTQSFLTARHITCCDTVECNPGGTCKVDEREYRNGEEYVTCSCHYPQSQQSHHSSSSSSWGNDHGGGMGWSDHSNHDNGGHYECPHK
jgi:hypothetical protein